MQLRRRRRVDGVGRPKFDFHTGCGLATQLFHNAALTAGRMAEAGTRPGTLEAMRLCIKEHGASALYVNYPYRVAVIALWTGILHVADPFRL